IRNLSQTIHLSGGSASMADLLNTPETRNYNIQSKQLFSKELTPEKIDELVHAGADVNYTFSPCNNGYYSYVLKHWISEKHYNNVEKLLKIGADVNTPNG